MRALFIAAHADDVEISAGGTIQTLVADDWEVWTTITILHPKERITEGVVAARQLGVTFMTVSGSIRELTDYWDGLNFDLIVTPSSSDSHPDHREAAALGVALARKNNVSLWEMNHAIPGGIYNQPDLNHFVRFTSEQWGVKEAAIMAYSSQWEIYGDWWINAIQARDGYYGLMVDRDNLTYAEGFHIVYS